MKFTTHELQEYQRELEARVCSLCRATGYEGVCAIGETGDCPIRSHLPRILKAVLSTPRSRDISAYVPRIREIVCSHCERQNEEGVCAARNLAMCGLDAYLLIAVQTIEEVHDRLASRSGSCCEATSDAGEVTPCGVESAGASA